MVSTQWPHSVYINLLHSQILDINPFVTPRSLLRPFCGHSRRRAESAESRALDAFLAVTEEFTQAFRIFLSAHTGNMGPFGNPRGNTFFIFLGFMFTILLLKCPQA